jgi:hypothetical protein
MRRLIPPALFLLGSVFLPEGAAAQEEPTCHYGQTAVELVAGYTVRLEPIPDDPTETIFECRALVLSPDGRTVFSARDSWFEINPASGKDLNGDRQPELVLEGYSGGAHCCWSYWIVSLGNPPGLLAGIYNERSVAFRDDDKDGRVEIWTGDGVFDYFDGLSHAESFFPTVALRLEGRTLRDAGPEFREQYEKEIAEARSQLNPEALKRFRRIQHICAIGGDEERECNVDTPEGEFMALRQVKALVSTIVLSYLYSGREAEAWKALDDMWPLADKERTKREFMNARQCGVLSYVYQGCPGKSVPSQEP